MSYTPQKIAGNAGGLVLSRENFLLPEDAYPQLINAFVWRERIKRKQGYQLLGRLQRSIGTTNGSGNLVVAITPIPITSGISSFTIGSDIFNDPGGVVNPVNMLTNSSGSGVLDRITGVLTITGSQANTSVQFIPGLPVMGLRDRELNNTNNEQMVAFDQYYAYKFVGAAFQEFLPGTTWTSTDSDFFWSTNYWVGDGNLKIFWVTNFKDAIRYTNGVALTNWINFSPTINSSLDKLENCLAMLPFRGRMVVFNTIEKGVNYSNRIRWAAIGNPFSDVSAIVTTVNPDAWLDDKRGKGGFLDIPTSESIITVGFVRDNLVIYCERSTWQLRYTGRSIAPFQIEKVNTELGAESTFSGIQFDTSLVGVGDKGIVECDSFKSDRIDIKIPDLVMEHFNNENQGTKRVHGIRDFKQRLAFWIYPETDTKAIFPNRRLCYNYENDSWAIFTDSLTALGTYQAQTSRTWANSKFSWSNANFTWGDRPALFPNIMGGNQQGFVLYLDKQSSNQESLFISSITGNVTSATLIKSPNHNLLTENIIQITNIPSGTPFAASLNNQIFSITKVDNNSFTISKYSTLKGQFTDPQIDSNLIYVGGGLIRVRDNFSIVSKRFNYMDQGQQYQLGYIDILMDVTDAGAFTLNIYNDYQSYEYPNASNQLPLNASNDTFFNQTIETSSQSGVDGGQKNWKRIFCATNSNFVTIEYTLSNEQMTTICQESDIQIDGQVIWSRQGGRLGLLN